MNIYAHFSPNCFRGICLLAFLNLTSVSVFAQKTPDSPAIRGAKTDNSYANRTEVSKAKNATDAQVLAEIEGNYGLGDVVRIVITTPKPTTEPLGRPMSGKPSTINVSPLSIPNGMLTPSNNLPTRQQETMTPPTEGIGTSPYNTSGQPIVTPTTRPNGEQLTPIGNKPAPQQGQTPPPYSGTRQSTATPTNRRNNNEISSIGGNAVPQQRTATPQYNTGGQPISTPSPRRNNSEISSIGGSVPQQRTTPPQYNAPNQQSNQQIATPTTRPNGSFTPINNAPVRQQGTTPPQYQPTPRAETLIVSSKTPDTGSQMMASTSNTIDLSSFFDKKEDTNLSKTVTNVINVSNTIEEKPVVEQRVERTVRTSERAERSSSSRASSSGSKASKLSKSSGFSFKNLFSFGQFKETKRRNMKSHKKYGCYRFN